MSALIGFLESVKPQFVIQPFELVKNKAGNLVVRSASIHYQNLPIVKRFGENEKLNARRRCDRGGMIGKSWTRCHYKINVNGKDAWVSEKYIGGQEEVLSTNPRLLRDLQRIT